MPKRLQENKGTSSSSSTEPPIPRQESMDQVETTAPGWQICCKNLCRTATRVSGSEIVTLDGLSGCDSVVSTAHPSPAPKPVKLFLSPQIHGAESLTNHGVTLP